MFIAQTFLLYLHKVWKNKFTLQKPHTHIYEILPGACAALCSTCNFTTWNPVHTEEWKPKTAANMRTTPSPTCLINARQGIYILQNYSKFKTFRTMQTKTAFMKKFRTNLTWEIRANLWSYVLSSCLLTFLGTGGYVAVLFEMSCAWYINTTVF